MALDATMTVLLTSAQCSALECSCKGIVLVLVSDVVHVLTPTYQIFVVMLMGPLGCLQLSSLK